VLIHVLRRVFARVFGGIWWDVIALVGVGVVVVFVRCSVVWSVVGVVLQGVSSLCWSWHSLLDVAYVDFAFGCCCNEWLCCYGRVDLVFLVGCVVAWWLV